MTCLIQAVKRCDTEGFLFQTTIFYSAGVGRFGRGLLIPGSNRSFYTAEASRLTVLVEQHPDWYPTHVETIQEILNVLADDRVRPVRLLVLHDALSHGGDDIVVPVPDFYHRVCETK